MVTGKVRPLMENCDPLTPSDDTVTAALLALSAPAWFWLVPTVMLPKLMLVGATANDPGSVPVPLDGTEKLGFDPLELIARLPVTLPAVWGANDALNVTL